MIRKINGIDVPKNFTTLGSTISQIVTNSNRAVSKNAPLTKELLATKKTFPVTWSRMTAEEYSTLYKALYGRNWDKLEYYDESSGTFIEGTFYHSDITFADVRCDEDMKPIYYREVSVEFIMR
ncbi:MAG: hypothetical protein IJ279_04145 [Clostridia bacterium]|nr:hypothetical protein [Clostridia bacterium]